jgi:hypothetical protein
MSRPAAETVTFGEQTLLGDSGLIQLASGLPLEFRCLRSPLSVISSRSQHVRHNYLGRDSQLMYDN